MEVEGNVHFLATRQKRLLLHGSYAYTKDKDGLAGTIYRRLSSIPHYCLRQRSSIQFETSLSEQPYYEEFTNPFDTFWQARFGWLAGMQ